MRLRSAWVLLSLLHALGCGSTPDADPDAGALDGAALCRSDVDCDDGVFCNGVERCMRDAVSADARGCLQFVSPCFEGQTCDEVMARCTTDCAVTRDADGDGFDAIECGGTDCDDAARERNPAAPEVCDAGDLDEDCDPETFGVRDADGDGYPDARCCNGDVCGSDCDDTSAAVNPLAVDTCDRAMRDEDCSGVPNDRAGGCECFDGDTQPCESFGACLAGVQTCVDGRFAACSISPIAEICDGRDEDCDGTIDEGLTVQCWPDADGDNLAPASDAATVCPDPVRTASPWFGCPANRVGIEPSSPDTIDCDDTSPVVRAAISCGVDGDADGYGGPAIRVCPAPDGATCPTGHAASTNDCCDTDARAFPGATAWRGTSRTGCGGFDFDCNGTVTLELARGLACGVFTVGETACNTRNGEFMAAPHFDSNMATDCGTTIPYIIGCTYTGTCQNVTESRLVRCR